MTVFDLQIRTKDLTPEALAILLGQIADEIQYLGCDCGYLKNDQGERCGEYNWS